MPDLFTTEQLLNMAISEHFAPGARVDLQLEMPRELTVAEVAMFQAHLRANGLPDAKAQFGATERWPDALRLVFSRPKHLVAPQQLQLIGLIAGALAILGIGAFAGWKIGTSVSQNLVPLALIAGGVVIMVALVVSQGNARYDITVRR